MICLFIFMTVQYTRPHPDQQHLQFPVKEVLLKPRISRHNSVQFGIYTWYCFKHPLFDGDGYCCNVTVDGILGKSLQAEPPWLVEWHHRLFAFKQTNFSTLAILPEQSHIITANCLNTCRVLALTMKHRSSTTTD